MTAGDLAVVLLGVASLVLAAVTAVLAVQVRAATRALRDAADRVALEVGPAADRAATAAADARAEVERIDALLTRSEGVVERVDSASELAHATFTRPVIKAMAVREGTTQAVRKLRGRPGS